MPRPPPEPHWCTKCPYLEVRIQQLEFEIEELRIALDFAVARARKEDLAHERDRNNAIAPQPAGDGSG